MSIFKLGVHPPQSWGSRSQLEATVKDLKDVKGNRDGIWSNEEKKAGTAGHFFERQPLVEKFRDSLGVGLSSKDEVELLQDFRIQKEKSWGEPVTQLELSEIKNGELFAAQKAIALDRLGRSPSEVTEGFVQASGKVDGQNIEPRELFWQRFSPIGEPSGKVVMLSPGFQETGRNFYEQIQQMNELGHDVIVMDHQWAGMSEGSPGGLDRGFGVARDVAAMAAFAQEAAEQSYGDNPNKELILFGNSMGAGPGVLGALTMNDNGLIQLDGAQMPKNLRAVLQAPFIAATPNKVNDALAFASTLPLLNRIEAPSAGVPVLTKDKIGAQKGAQSAVLEDVRAQLRSMSAANDDMDKIRELIENDKGPGGSLFIVHGDNDPLADPAKSVELAKRLGSRAELHMIDSDNHVLEQNPEEQGFAINGLQRLIGSE